MGKNKAESRVFDQIQVLVARELMQEAVKEPTVAGVLDAKAHEHYARILEGQEAGFEEVGKLSELVNAYWKAVKEGDVSTQTVALSDIRFRAKVVAAEFVRLAVAAQVAMIATDEKKDAKP